VLTLTHTPAVVIPLGRLLTGENYFKALNGTQDFLSYFDIQNISSVTIWYLVSLVIKQASRNASEQVF